MAFTPDEGQAKAIAYGPGPLLIVAGAGTGKTSTLIRRIDRLVADGTRPRRILAITFTRKAALELKTRLTARSQGVRASTIHAWCARMLHRFAPTGPDGEPVDLSMLDDDGRRRMAREIVAPWIADPDSLTEAVGDAFRGLFDFGRFLAVYAEALGADTIEAAATTMRNALAARMLVYTGLLYNANRTAEQGWRRLLDDLAAGRLACDEEGRLDQESCRRVVEARAAMEYERLMRERHCADFDFLQRLAFEAMDANPSVLEAVRSQYDYVFVDEYQDTSRVQVDLTELIASACRNLAVVGDPDQSIYSWRGAERGTMDAFARRHPDAYTVHISTNYRSRQAILDAANHVIADNGTDVIEREPLRAPYRLRGSAEPPTLAGYDTDRIEAAAIASMIERIHAHGEPHGSIAVLMRLHALATPIERELRRRHIPYNVVGAVSFYDHTVVKDLLAYLTVLFNPLDDMAFMRVLNTPRRKLGPRFVNDLVTEQGSYETRISLFETMRRGMPSYRGVTAEGARAFVDTFVHAYDHGFKVHDILDGLIRAVDYRGWIAVNDKDPAKRAADLDLVDDMLAMATSFDAENESVPTDATAARRDVAAFVAWIATQAELEKQEGADTVSFMTVHAAKGLEFDTVFLVGADDGIFPSGQAIAERGVAEERRLMYVALTRARKRLVVTHARRRRVWGEDMHPVISRFVAPHRDDYRVVGIADGEFAAAMPHNENGRPARGRPR